MSSYRAPLEDMKFLLEQVFQVDDLWQQLSNTEDLNLDLALAILEEGAKICEQELQPLNRNGDEQGCRIEHGQVITPDGFKEAYQTFTQNGWQSLSGDPAYGGQGMPKMLTALFEEMLYGANCSFALYPALTSGACLALIAHANESLKSKFLPKMYSGEWAGAMDLTEPHCGTDLGLIKTRAEVIEGREQYSITGTKIFITGGDQDLSENIIHLVLAKLPDAPGGTKGISLFLVPKLDVLDDGSLGQPNGVSCGSLEHKMGIKGSSTCVMNFDQAKGYLVGQPHRGLAAMFTMMNYERLSIGLQGVGLGEVSYQNALAYAKERPQGRSARGPKQPDKAADSILVHADVRRMLLTQKALTEAGRCFAIYVASHLDSAKHHLNAAERDRSEHMVALLTPVAKAFFTDRGFDVCVLGQQILGGHGYIREWGLEQFVRDARIAQIYEGTNGIQALDLISRKVLADEGKSFLIFYQEVQEFCQHQDFSHCPEILERLQNTLDRLHQCTEFLLQHHQEDPELPGAASCDYLNLFGLTAYCYMWAKMTISPLADTAQGQDKLATARFFIHKLLPDALSFSQKILTGAQSLVSLDE